MISILHKPLQYLSILAFLVVCLQSCVIEEHYHFNKDLSGTYTMDFNFSALAENDSTGEMKADMGHTLDSLELVMSDIPGVSNVSSELTDGNMNLKCDFDGIATLNRMDEDNEIDSVTGMPIVKVPVFTRKGKLLSIRPDVQSTQDDIGGSGESPPEDATDEDIEQADEMAASMFQIITKITFEGSAKVKKMEHFEKVDSKTYIYDSEKQGLKVQPVLVVKY